ncbi:MAG TPA: MFS transporter [Candidatus Limnocylindrales bacterium]|nr:MFS transporter [Candidatus Limnocylindrales bacterium]
MPASDTPGTGGAGSRAVLFFTVFIHLLGFGIIIPLLPYYAEHFGASGLTVGLLGTSFSLAQFLFAPLWGRLSDRIGRRPVLLGSLILTGVSYLVFAVAGSLPVLFVSRIFAGIAGATLSTAQAYIADTTTPENRTRGMGLIGAAFGMGFIFGPAMGGVLSRWGFSVPAYAAAGLAAAAFLFAVARLPESLPREEREAASRRRARASFRDALGRPVVGIVLGLFFVATLCFSGMEAILALFCERFFRWGPHQIGYLFAYVGVVAALMQAGIVGALAKRFGERALVRAGLALMGAAFVAAGLVPPLALFLATMGVIAVGSGLITPTLSSLVSQATPPDEQGRILGVYQSLGSLGRAVGPFLGGLLYDVVGPGAPLWSAGAVLLMAALAAVRIPLRKQPPSGEGSAGR